MKKKQIEISIHTLRVEGDSGIFGSNIAVKRFQSTPSAWRVTVTPCTFVKPPSISIHTLRVEGDPQPACSAQYGTISIHTLRVEGDDRDFRRQHAAGISIHTLRVEGDEDGKLLGFEDYVFQSTPSAWRVTSISTSTRRTPIFQSTPSAWRVTAKAHKKAARFCSK